PTTIDATARWARGNCMTAAVAATGAQLMHLPGPLDQLRRSSRVVIGGAGSRVGQYAAVEHAAADDRDTRLRRGGQQVVEPGLVEQRGAAGQQDSVDVRVAHEAGEHGR